MSISISYPVALDGIFNEAEDVAYLVSLVEDHKNWGAFKVRQMPSHMICLLIDEIKRLKEQQLGFYGQQAPKAV